MHERERDRDRDRQTDRHRERQRHRQRHRQRQRQRERVTVGMSVTVMPHTLSAPDTDITMQPVYSLCVYKMFAFLSGLIPKGIKNTKKLSGKRSDRVFVGRKYSQLVAVDAVRTPRTSHTSHSPYAQ